MLTIAIDHLFSVLSFVVENVEKFERNSEIHSVNTRHKHEVFVQNANPTSHQKGVYCVGTKQYSAIPSSIKILNHDIKGFKTR
jgi:hypothetical protein